MEYIYTNLDPAARSNPTAFEAVSFQQVSASSLPAGSFWVGQAVSPVESSFETLTGGTACGTNAAGIRSGEFRKWERISNSE